MTLHPIDVPDHLDGVELSARELQWIDLAHERIESFLLADRNVIEQFVPCDFHLLAQSLVWIQQQHLAPGNRFLELGSGFGVATLLAAGRGMEAYGIEIEPRLVHQAALLAEELLVEANFFSGSFVPRNVRGLNELAAEMKHVETHPGDVFDEIGLSINDFDLFFAFPWPGEHEFFEAIVEACAAEGSLLLTYRGREGMHLTRKLSV